MEQLFGYWYWGEEFRFDLGGMFLKPACAIGRWTYSSSNWHNGQGWV